MTLRQLALLFPAVLIAGCEKKVTAPVVAVAPAPAAPAKPVESDTILVGEVDAQTGNEGMWGTTNGNGIALAIEEANAAGGVKGKKLVIRRYDSSSRPEEAANAAKRLITQDKVVALLGEVASSSSLAMAPIAQDAKVPMISPSSVNSAVTKVGDYIFRACFIDSFQGPAMAKFAREQLKMNRVAIFVDKKTSYSVGLAEFFQKKFTELGGKIVSTESYAKGDSDFRAQLTNMKKLKVDGLYIPGYYEDIGRIALQAKELHFKAPLLGTDAWDSSKLFEIGGKALEGSYITSFYAPDDPSPRVRTFTANYKARFGNEPDSIAVSGYDAAGMLIDAMKRAKSLSGPDLRDAIATTKDYAGVTGDITLDADRNPIKPAVIVVIKDQKFQYRAVSTP